MKTEYTNDHSRCWVVPSTAVDGVLEIVGVFTAPEHRGEGHCKALLAEVCKDADIEREVLMLSCAAEIADVYKPHGFMTIQKRPHLMARMPVMWVPKISEIGDAAQRVVYG